MKPIQKLVLDICKLRLPVNVKRLLESGELHTYDILNMMGNTINSIAHNVEKNVKAMREFAESFLAQEKERIENEKERIAAEDHRKENEDVRELNETVRKRNEKWRQQNEAERIEAENIRKANEADRIAHEKVREANETKRIELYNEAKDVIIPEAKRATAAADNATKSAEVVLDKIAQKEYGAVNLTANEMRELIEQRKVNAGLKYLVVADNRVVGVYYGKMPQAGCELAVINQTLVGRSAI